MEAKNFEDLKLWQRAAVSVPSNIAEGNAGCSKKEFSHFLVITYGSLAELKTQVLIAKRLEYVTVTESSKIFAWIDEVTRMLHGALDVFYNCKLLNQPNI